MVITELDKLYAIKLKTLRKSNKLSQEKVFKSLGLDSQQWYSHLEKGKKHFTNSIVLSICDLFNISILQFINNDESGSNLSLFLSEEDYNIIENSYDNVIKITLYRKLLIESKIENTELKLKLLHKDFGFKKIKKNKTHVII
jgi:transcriptional regulator with XRE-family HTH domain